MDGVEKVNNKYNNSHPRRYTIYVYIFYSLFLFPLLSVIFFSFMKAVSV